MIGHLFRRAAVALRTHKAGAPILEVQNLGAGWFYHQRVGANITNVSEHYASKWNATRAATAQAYRMDGSVVRVFD